MINVTLPDDKSNYLHRIGRVGRAERMGLAISLVAQLPEKVWFHGEWCKSRGRNCSSTRLTDQGSKVFQITFPSLAGSKCHFLNFPPNVLWNKRA
jgi:superfamily II DNA/RNA helicase